MTHLAKLFADGPNTVDTSLSALILGTGVGRPMAGSAMQDGTLTLVGRLAYRASKDFRQGRPVWGAGTAQPSVLAPAPEGSGFEPGAVSHARAVLLIRAMIAAADAGGGLHADDRREILEGLKRAGLEGGARQFLKREFDRPATAEQLARAVRSPAEGVHVYTAARIAMHLTINEGNAFLLTLAARLGIDSTLAAHIDAAARSPDR
jgi:uncharacterized membrane protein YebE (DUF533 family)